MIVNIIRAVCLVVFSLITYSSHTDVSAGREEEKAYLDGLLENKLEEYQRVYPKFTFLVLQGGTDLVADMMTFAEVIGHEPVSLDYEHPPELREDLIHVSANRILQMLQYGIPSAALFKANAQLGGQDNICVLTINPSAIASSPMLATENLLGMSSSFIKDIPENLLLLPEDYLAYVVDHEVYHCLQSKFIGPQPISKKELWGDYWHYLSELGADSYALGMHIKGKGSVTSFVTNVNRIRGTVLYTADPNHFTCGAIDQVLSIPPEEISGMSAEEVFALAVKIRNKLSISYDEYLQFMASAVEVMRLLGVKPVLGEDAAEIIIGVEPDPSRVQSMLDKSELCLKELSG
mgnify:FL=1